MSDSDSKHEQVLKRTQLIIGVLVGVISLAVGVYNFKNAYFSKKGPGKVIIRVSSEKGLAISGAALEIAKAQGGLVSSSETDSEGKFERSLEPGNYSLKITKIKFQPESTFFTIEPGESADLNIKLKASYNAIQSAVEEVGASWLKQIASPKPKAEENQAAKN